MQGVTGHRDPNRAVSGRVRQVVFIYRFNNMGKIQGLHKTGLYRQVVFIYRWSLEQV